MLNCNSQSVQHRYISIHTQKYLSGYRIRPLFLLFLHHLPAVFCFRFLDHLFSGRSADLKLSDGAASMNSWSSHIHDLPGTICQDSHSCRFPLHFLYNPFPAHLEALTFTIFSAIIKKSGKYSPPDQSLICCGFFIFRQYRKKKKPAFPKTKEEFRVPLPFSIRLPRHQSCPVHERVCGGR